MCVFRLVGRTVVDGHLRTMAAIEGKIAQNPDLLSSGGLMLPAFVDRNPQARARVMAQLAQVAADAYRGAGQRSS